MKNLSVLKLAGCDELRAIHEIGCVNWPEKFPYAPEVRFGIAHNDDEIYLRFEVREQAILGLVTTDNGAVWEDSCVEFFLSLDDAGYYNFEFNCIGTKLLGFRKDREKFTHAPTEIMQSIQATPSLGDERIELREGDIRWNLDVVIPVRALFRHKVSALTGVTAQANFYKCGDALPTPHFLSWNPIVWPEPNFHRPEQFGEIRFE